MPKDPVSSPMKSVRPAPGVAGAPGTYDKHETPELSTPHSKGKDTLPLKFFEKVEGSPAALSTPMGTAIEGLGRGKKKK